MEHWLETESISSVSLFRFVTKPPMGLDSGEGQWCSLHDAQVYAVYQIKFQDFCITLKISKATLCFCDTTLHVLQQFIFGNTTG